MIVGQNKTDHNIFHQQISAELWPSQVKHLCLFNQLFHYYCSGILITVVHFVLLCQINKLLVGKRLLSKKLNKQMNTNLLIMNQGHFLVTLYLPVQFCFCFFENRTNVVICDLRECLGLACQILVEMRSTTVSHQLYLFSALPLWVMLAVFQIDWF